MVINVNIKLFDNTPWEEYEESGITIKLIEVMTKKVFEDLLAKACVDCCIDDGEYSVDVKVEK